MMRSGGPSRWARRRISWRLVANQMSGTLRRRRVARPSLGLREHGAQIVLFDEDRTMVTSQSLRSQCSRFAGDIMTTSPSTHSARVSSSHQATNSSSVILSPGGTFTSPTGGDSVR